MRTILLLAAFSAMPLTLPAHAHGTERTDRPTVVSYSDLDLRNQSGVSTLDGRIRAAVRDACGTASIVDLQGKNNVRDCRVAAMRHISVQRDRAIAAASLPSREVLVASQ